MRKIGSLLVAALLVVAVGCGSDGGATKTDAAGGSSGNDGGTTPGIDSSGGGSTDTNTAIDANNTPDAPIVIDTSRVDGGAVDGTAIDAGTCVLPSCMAAGGQGCLPAGACTAQTAGTTTNRCYANGVGTVSQGAITDPTGMTVTFKNIDGVTVDGGAIDGGAIDGGTTIDGGNATDGGKNGAGFCYALSVDVSVLTAFATQTAATIPIKNAAGITVGTLSYDFPTAQTTVTCQGAQPVVLGPACASTVQALTAPANACTPGACQP